MTSRTLYQCTCAADGTYDLPHALATGAALSALALGFSPLYSLYYCPDCACVRCNECIAWEVIGYFCPNCLFEVPSTSVKAQKSRCVPLLAQQRPDLQLRTKLLRMPELHACPLGCGE